eukprot:CAMPEP_0176435152 /NCGR_PEP_ID=MMETSP0127-20121128/17129_1 /TAXON_ID=938130 /ORGANISM="Platyophrya macrostoma, Strain WH" /LENGTH=76 /DNA_ID=CAMNT_0017818079 /DNA_START=416 /DNA_END=646 /DNA_ORIENTATION=+
MYEFEFASSAKKQKQSQEEVCDSTVANVSEFNIGLQVSNKENIKRFYEFYDIQKYLQASLREMLLQSKLSQITKEW